MLYSILQSTCSNTILTLCIKLLSQLHTEAMSKAAFLALPGLLQEKVEDLFVPPDTEVSLYSYNKSLYLYH